MQVQLEREKGLGRALSFKGDGHRMLMLPWGCHVTLGPDVALHLVRERCLSAAPTIKHSQTKPT